jgi:hypothetical protein
MTSDLDIYRTALALIREHDDEAGLVAATGLETGRSSGGTLPYVRESLRPELIRSDSDAN